MTTCFVGFMNMLPSLHAVMIYTLLILLTGEMFMSLGKQIPKV